MRVHEKGQKEAFSHIAAYLDLVLNATISGLEEEIHSKSLARQA
ncbi:MAG: hypothetical protein AAGF04_00750 [Chlamydiota bacterium]